MLGGPYASIAAKFVSDALGLDRTKIDSLPSVFDNLSTDPDLQAKLRQIDEDLKKYQLSIGASDTENARQTQVDEEKIGKNPIMPIVITVFLMLLVATIIIFSFTPLSGDIKNQSLIGTITGLITREFIQACRYYIGGDGSVS